MLGGKKHDVKLRNCWTAYNKYRFKLRKWSPGKKIYAHEDTQKLMLKNFLIKVKFTLKKKGKNSFCTNMAP